MDSKLVIEHFKKLINSPAVPELDGEMSEDPVLVELQEQILSIRQLLYAFSTGDLSPEIRIRGFIAGNLKALQAHLRHMTWQVQQVERGDFSQRVDFLGDFSIAFNNMVIKLDETMSDLKKKEEALLDLTNSLQTEVNLRSSAMEALQESEARFKYLASHDPLTGALNRRSFLDRAVNELKLSFQRGELCAISIMDVDHFKRFNDTYGHQRGDEALKHVVKISTQNLRHGDLLGRYGGEEFIFLFTNVDLDHGVMVADRICKAIAETPFMYKGDAMHVSASFGVSGTDEDIAYSGDYIQQLISNADAALYHAKATGRSRVVSYTPELSK
jgi:diguanylate cyclase (GGDEF)-like protein